MLQRIAISLVVLTAAACFAGSAVARNYHHINPIPFSHNPCSVFDRGPCTPSYCGVFNHGPCIPDIDYPYGENLQLTVRSVPPKKEASRYRKPEHKLNTIGDLFAALRACWSPPPAAKARKGMQIAVRFSFKTSGELIGPPRLTYVTPGVPAATRDTYLKAIDTSLDRCLPLHFTKGLAGALAGRPISVRYVDNRDLGKSSGK
jgi:hypothetical protein